MLYAIAGDGAGNATEIKATLVDLREKATKDEAEFWFVLIVKDEPSKTDEGILKWLKDNEIYFEAVGEESDAYEGAQAYHDPGDDPYQALLAVLDENKGDGVALLALFVDAEADDEADADLYAMIEQAIENEVEVRLLNGQMVRLQLTGDDEAEAEPETVEAEEADEDEPDGPLTAAEMKKMTVPELTALAKGQGLSFPKGTSKGDIIAALTANPGEFDTTAAPARVTGVSTNGTTAMIIVLLNGGVHIRQISEAEATALV